MNEKTRVPGSWRNKRDCVAMADTMHMMSHQSHD